MNAEYHQANKDKKNKRRKERIKVDLKFKLCESARNCIRYAIKHPNSSSLLLKHLGYTGQELIRHIEKHFKPGMKWANRTEWHIDHIVPVKDFHFITIEDENFKQCWKLSNLQPLWSKENLCKGCRTK